MILTKNENFDFYFLIGREKQIDSRYFCSSEQSFSVSSTFEAALTLRAGVLCLTDEKDSLNAFCIETKLLRVAHMLK